MRNIITDPIYIKIVVRRHYKLVTKRKKERKDILSEISRFQEKKYNLVKLTQEKNKGWNYPIKLII